MLTKSDPLRIHDQLDAGNRGLGHSLKFSQLRERYLSEVTDFIELGINQRFSGRGSKSDLPPLAVQAFILGHIYGDITFSRLRLNHWDSLEVDAL